MAHFRFFMHVVFNGRQRVCKVVGNNIHSGSHHHGRKQQSVPTCLKMQYHQWLQNVSNCIEFHSISPNSFHKKFGFKDLISFLLSVIKVSLIIHHRGFKASREICFGGCLLRWQTSQPIKLVSCDGFYLLFPNTMHPGSLSFVEMWISKALDKG